MNYHVELLSDAEEDIDNAYIWYEHQQIGLGNTFYNSINESITLICRNPFSSRELYKNARRFIIKKFPYGLYYRVLSKDNIIQIVGVIHFRRSVRIVRKRI